MTSRPAAPESETPETDVFSNPSTEGDDDSYVTVENYNDLLKHSTKLERRLSLAQTEIKGHMRVEDELKAELMAEVDTVSALVRERKEAQARIAELEKDRDSWKREAEMMANAWQRELCDQGILYRPKTHWIDFMVLATRKVMTLAKENGVSCCDQPELCAKTDCNKLLRFRLDAALKSRA